MLCSLQIVPLPDVCIIAQSTRLLLVFARVPCSTLLSWNYPLNKVCVICISRLNQGKNIFLRGKFFTSSVFLLPLAKNIAVSVLLPATVPKKGSFSKFQGFRKEDERQPVTVFFPVVLFSFPDETNAEIIELCIKWNEWRIFALKKFLQCLCRVAVTGQQITKDSKNLIHIQNTKNGREKKYGKEFPCIPSQYN